MFDGGVMEGMLMLAILIVISLIVGVFLRETVSYLADWKVRRVADREQRRRYLLAMCPDGCLMVRDEVE